MAWYGVFLIYWYGDTVTSGGTVYLFSKATCRRFRNDQHSCWRTKDGACYPRVCCCWVDVMGFNVWCMSVCVCVCVNLQIIKL